MLSNLCIAFCLFAMVVAAPKGGNGGNSTNGGPGGRGGPGGPGGHGGPPPPPFLQNVTDDARKAFFDIVSNGNLTQNQIDSQTASWASTYGVSALYTEFQQNKTAFESALQSNISTIIGNLASVNSQLNTIFTNKDQTRDQAKTAVDAVRADHPVEVDVVMFLNHPGPHGPPGGPGGRDGPGGFGGASSGNSTKTSKKNKKNNSSSR